jgi:hypothetical protein
MKYHKLRNGRPGWSMVYPTEIRKYILENYKGVGPTSFLIRTGDKVSD